jgi:AraC-like DNA-binding protein
MLVTSDPHVAHTWLRATYPGYLPEETNSRRDFAFQAVHEEAGRSGVSRLRYSTSADNNVAPDVLLVVRPSAGAMMVRFGREEVAVPPGTPVLLPARQAVSVLWADTEAGCVCLNADDVERVAVETTGLDDLALRFTGLRPMLPSLDQRWNDTVQAVTRAVLRNRTMAGPLLTGHLTQRLAEAVLLTFPSTSLATRRRVPPDHATPAVVRRAVDFIDANAERDLTTSDIAAAAGIGPRGLQAAFLRHRGSTSTAYVRRVRLDRAHRELVDTDPAERDDPVPAVAARWGFPRLSAFVTAHQQVYGRPPGQTPHD